MQVNSAFRSRAPRADSMLLLATLAGAAIEILIPWALGPGRADMFSMAGALARYLAGWVAPPPSLVRAGSDHAAAALTIFLCLAGGLCALFLGAVLLRSSRPRMERRPRNVLLALQMAVVVLLHSVVLGMVLAATLPRFLPPRRALTALALLLAASVAAIVALAGWLMPAELPAADGARVATVLYVILEQLVQVLTFGLGWLAARERRSKDAIAAKHAELLGMQALLSDTVRGAERLRIARDLHDTTGHHLTALQLHLDLACRKAGAAAGAELLTAHGLARELLAQVREVVGAERAERGIDLKLALERMCAAIPRPAIRLQVADGLALHSPAVAYALFCCIQEAVSNVVRHAGALTMHIAIERQGGAVHATIADDGCGRGAAAEGNGLRGMRERLALLGGTLQAGDLPRRGFGLEIRLPLAGVLS